MAEAPESDAAVGAHAETPSAESAGGDSRVTAALRANARYVEEVVIGWNLCPWAGAAWRSGEVARRVLPDDPLDVAPVLTFIDDLCADPALAIGLAIFARASVTAAGFGTFAERVRRADRARRSTDEPAPFMLAAFHPDLPVGPDFKGAGELVSFIRRAPDPTLQLVRASRLGALSRDGRDLSAEIARDNAVNVGARGPSALAALLDDIRRDRGR